MALSSALLLERLQSPDPDRRLVVSPILDPKEQIKEHQAAIDVRLGRVFSLVRPWTQGVAELFEPETLPPQEDVILDFGEPLIIHPHQFVLARTLEFIRLPSDMLAYVVGRSSWGRRGLIVATAVVVHPGFSGPITLELKNVGEVPLALYPMDRVAQLTFHPVDTRQSRPTATSQFASTYKPTLGKVRDATTEQRLRSLVKSRQAE